MGIEGVSYGGQLTDWLITQTNEFKAAIPTAGIANLVSYNYMTYYNQYEEMEFGQFLHQGNLMDIAWERSALKHIAAAHTRPSSSTARTTTMFRLLKRSNFSLRLRTSGGDGFPSLSPGRARPLRDETPDRCDRSIHRLYERHFPKRGEEGVTNVQP